MRSTSITWLQVVLGLLAPLVLNAGCAVAAEAACEHYKLPDADCAQLWCASSSFRSAAQRAMGQMPRDVAVAPPAAPLALQRYT